MMIVRLAHCGFVMLMILAAAAGSTAAAQGRGRGGGSAGASARTASGPAMSRNSAAPAARPPAMAGQPAYNRAVTGPPSQIVRVPDRHVIIATPPYFGYYGGYYNGFYNGLYNGFYDPYPYASAPYYPVAPYETSYAEQSYAPPSPSPGELQLSNQVERLTREVQQLRQDQSQAALQQALAPPLRIAEPPPIPITLVFRDGRRLTTQSYAISRQTLWVVGDRMSMRVDLKDLDLPATQQANLGRVLLLPVPTQ